MSIRLRLTLWYTGILAAILLAFSVGLYVFIYNNLYGDLKSRVSAQADQLISEFKPVFERTRSGLRFGGIRLPSLDAFQSDMVIQVLDPNGEIVAQSSNLTIAMPYNDQTLKNAVQSSYFYERATIGNVSVLIHNRPIKVADQLAGIVRVAIKKDFVDNTLESLKYTLILISSLGILLTASGGWFLARKSLKPIENVIDAANRIEKSADLDKRIEYDGPPDEIGRLTDTINGMLSRIQIMYSELDEAYRAQRRFVSDASHELRTPLTTIRGNVDLLEKVWKAAGEGSEGLKGENVELSLEAMHDIAAEAERMSRLVNDMLSLARADAGYSMHKERVELKPLVEEVARRAQFLPRTAEWQVGDTSILEGAAVHGNKDYLQQLLFIFIENAFKYTDSGSVKLDFLRMNGQIGLRIADTGIGMDKDEIPHIFERFYRADVSRGKKAGTGLGLSIAKWIIDEHGGSVEVKTRKGEGTTFVVWLPEDFGVSDRRLPQKFSE